jgi:hypothetical protein
VYVDHDTIVPKNVPYIWDILQASRLSLEEIHISFYWKSLENPFWQMDFPRLRLLDLAFWDSEQHEDEGLAMFLVANPSVRELKLHAFSVLDFRTQRYLLVRPTGPLGAESSLPSLQVLSGSLIVFLQFARHQPRCFQTTLHTINLSLESNFDTYNCTVVVLDRLLESGLPRPLLPALKHFNLDFQYNSKLKAKHYPSLVRR